jgi:LPXTG-motif cell wall-anchored protein
VQRQPLAGTRRTAGTTTGDAAYAVGPSLPFTGSDSKMLLALAGALLLAGSALLLRASVLDQRHRSY